MYSNNKTAEEILNERRERQRAYMKKYRGGHPEYVYRNRVRSAVSLLTREGYTVTPPIGHDGSAEE